MEDGCRQVAQTLFPSVPPQRPLSWRELAFGFTRRGRPRRLPAPVGPLWENRLQRTTTVVVREREKAERSDLACCGPELLGSPEENSSSEEAGLKVLAQLIERGETNEHRCKSRANEGQP